MKGKKITNRHLDALGRTILRSGTAGTGEIEKIVSDPRLFDRVLAQIAAGELEERGTTVRISWKPITAFCGLLVLLTVPLLGYLKFPGSESASQPRVLPVTLTVESDARPFVPDLAKVPTATERPTIVPAVFTKRTEKPAAEPKVRPQKIKPKPPEAAFLPIGLSTGAEDAVIDGRVVRVEMPRAALFALGVDLPLENGTKAVKADLLVGADGIPRGIRLVE